MLFKPMWPCAQQAFGPQAEPSLCLWCSHHIFRGKASLLLLCFKEEESHKCSSNFTESPFPLYCYFYFLTILSQFLTECNKDMVAMCVIHTDNLNEP